MDIPENPIGTLLPDQVDPASLVGLPRQQTQASRWTGASCSISRVISKGPALSRVRFSPIVGGFHLLNASDRDLEWTGRKIREVGVRQEPR